MEILKEQLSREPEVVPLQQITEQVPIQFDDVQGGDEEQDKEDE